MMRFLTLFFVCFLVFSLLIPHHELSFAAANSDVASPKQQLSSGVPMSKLMCKEGFELVSKVTDNSPACVRPQTAEKIINRGWGLVLYRSVLTQCSAAMESIMDLYTPTSPQNSAFTSSSTRVADKTCYLLIQSNHTSLAQGIEQLEDTVTFPLIISTNKFTYSFGEQVIIELKNIGKEAILFSHSPLIVIAGPLPNYYSTSCCLGSQERFSPLLPNETKTIMWDQLAALKQAPEGFYEIYSVYGIGNNTEYGASTLINIVK